MCYLVSVRVICEAAMQNPTLVVVTDRNDLDDQLFGTLFDALICSPRFSSDDRPG